MSTNDWSLAGAEGQAILGCTHQPPAGTRTRGTLIISHGFKGYMDYGLFPMLAEQAAAQGMVVHRFNFSHSGMTRNTETFERDDLFEKDTWSKQVQDLQTVADAAAAGKIAGSGLPQVWFGHSRGGVTTLLAAARAFAQSTTVPVGVVTAAAPATACSMDEDQKQMLRTAGRVASPSSRTGQTLYVGKTWLTEIDQNPADYDPVKAAAGIACPLLIIHGTNDQTVAPAAAQQLAAAAGPRAQLQMIEGASHTFDAPNPLPTTSKPPAATQQLIDLTCRFALECYDAPMRT